MQSDPLPGPDLVLHGTDVVVPVEDIDEWEGENKVKNQFVSESEDGKGKVYTWDSLEKSHIDAS